MAAVLLDTTVLIDLLRGRPETSARIRALRTHNDILYTSAVNVEEVTRGLRPNEAPAANALFRALRIAPLGRAEGAAAGLWRRQFAERSRTLSQADCLIAAAVVSLDARLATGNLKDFPMADVLVEDWPAGR
jgi:predicted nucleic acid-binding protein